ncbi:MAG: hypothetical protein WC246_00685 [Candidatus Paceibacterota bacterium]
MATYRDVRAVYQKVLVAVAFGYTLEFAHEFNRQAMALDTAFSLEQGVDWDQEADMLLVVSADTVLGKKSEGLFLRLRSWLAEQGFLP